VSGLEDQYPWHGPRNIRRWTREVVYVRPGTFVVHDRTAVTDGSLDQRLAFHLSGRPHRVASAPGVTGYDVSSRGRYVGRVDTILPRGGRDRIVDVFHSGKVFRLERHGIKARRQEWLTVFDAARSRARASRAEVVDVVDGPVSGVLLRRGGHDEAVVLSQREPSRPVTGTIRYRIPARPTRHLVAGLRPGASYGLTTSGAGNVVTVVLRRAPGRKASRAGVLRFFTSK
jgi:hypothetical protein